jgi:hypothetical protein
MGAFQEIGARLIERGYAAVPIIPGTKRPGVLSNGRWTGLPRWQDRYSKRPPSEFEIAHWCEGDAGIGIVCGSVSRGAVAFDVDTDVPKIRATLDAILPGTSVRKIGKRGETLFYFAPHVTASKSWKIDGQVVAELIGPGRQTVIPPTIHPDTLQPYRWSGIEGLDAVSPEELPLLPVDFVEQIDRALALFGYGDAEPASTDVDESPHRQLNEAALAGLHAWVPALPLFRCKKTRLGYQAVPTWRPSSRGLPDDKRSCNLSIHPDGIRDFGTGQGLTPLDLVMRALDCDIERAFGFLGDRLGWTTPTVALKAEAAAEAETEPLQEPLLPYTTVPGMVGDIVDWITVTARRPNRVLALGAAVTVVGTLIGRRVAGPTRSATHLYVVGIGATGGGKQHILDSAIRLLKAGGAGGHIGPAKFFSLSAMIDLLDYKPLALCPQDEIGVFLKAITARRASSHEAAVSQILRSLWGVSFATVPTPAWAERRTSLVSCPAISVLGMSTPEEFHSALQGESVNNGFLNRFLALQSNLRVTDTNPASLGTEMPASLREALRTLHLWSGPQSLLQINNPAVEYAPDVLPWASDAASAVYRDLVAEIERRMDEQPHVVPYVARCGEIAIRLATIRAAGRWGRGATVDAADMEWAAGVAWTAGQAMADAIVDQMPDTERGVFADKLLEIIRRRGEVKVRDIQMAIRGRLRSAEIKDILRQLIEAGAVEFTADGKYRAGK